MLRRFLVPLLTAVALTATAGPAVAQDASAGTLYCGEVNSVIGTALQVVVAGGECGNAKTVVRDYLTAIRKGKCTGRGQSCRMTVRKHTCTVNTAAKAKETGIAAKCTTRGRRITAEDR